MSDRKISAGPKQTKIRNRLALRKDVDVASATTVTLGIGGNYFQITGTTTIDYITITDWEDGAIVVLEFTGSVTVTNLKGAPVAGTSMELKLTSHVNLSAAAGDTLTLVKNGTYWREIARSVY